MNVDILEIKKQAIINAALSLGYGDGPDCKRDISWFNVDSDTAKEEIDEEFAKLIAQECMLMVVRAIRMELSPIDCIKTHFGVK